MIDYIIEVPVKLDEKGKIFYEVYTSTSAPASIHPVKVRRIVDGPKDFIGMYVMDFDVEECTYEFPFHPDVINDLSNTIHKKIFATRKEAVERQKQVLKLEIDLLQKRKYNAS